MTSGGKSNETKSYNHTAGFVCAYVSGYCHAIFQFSHHLLSTESSFASYIPTDVLKMSETDALDREANHRFRLCCRNLVPQSFGCHRCGTSSKLTAGCPDQRIARGRLHEV